MVGLGEHKLAASVEHRTDPAMEGDRSRWAVHNPVAVEDQAVGLRNCMVEADIQDLVDHRELVEDNLGVGADCIRVAEVDNLGVEVRVEVRSLGEDTDRFAPEGKDYDLAEVGLVEVDDIPVVESLRLYQQHAVIMVMVGHT